ncbi:MAG: ribbon-helix-helix protein, CopG family [Cyanobacteria bacterium]|nr:ribbon-helix-helix protein, CopG family [Cyanobacteriota bacterium]
MKAKRINITIPGEDLKEINEFCIEEGIGKSQLVREAAVKYIANIKEQKKMEKRKQEIESAVKVIGELRKKVKFKNNKTAAEMVRELRDSR